MPAPRLRMNKGYLVELPHNRQLAFHHFCWWLCFKNGPAARAKVLLVLLQFKAATVYRVERCEWPCTAVSVNSILIYMLNKENGNTQNKFRTRACGTEPYGFFLQKNDRVLTDTAHSGYTEGNHHYCYYTQRKRKMKQQAFYQKREFFPSSEMTVSFPR